MPRRRTSQKPLLRRAKLNSREEINREQKRIYRLAANKLIPAAEAARYIDMLSDIGDNLEETAASVGPFVNVNVYSVSEQHRSHRSGAAAIVRRQIACGYAVR
jgi:hypothetical protein